MTTNMAVPKVKDFGPPLDERIAYGNLPRWIADGIPIRGLNIPNYTNLNQQPPLYAGFSSGVINYGSVARQNPNLTAHNTALVGDPKQKQMTSYVPRNNPELRDCPFVYSTPAVINPQLQPKRSWKYNKYNTHAKSGFKFWMEEKKPMSKSQKYTLGTAKTFHGLGDAPRN